MLKIYLSNLFIFPVIIIIKTYQLIISPILKNNCRYLPSCSEYSILAFKEHGLLIGFYYSLKRIFKCHPLGGNGYEPVPKKIKKKI